MKDRKILRLCKDLERYYDMHIAASYWHKTLIISVYQDQKKIYNTKVKSSVEKKKLITDLKRMLKYRESTVYMWDKLIYQVNGGALI